MCYRDTLPVSVNLSKPCTLSIVRNRGMIKIYLNGIWVTEFDVGSDETANTLFNNDMFMSIFSVGTRTSVSEFNLRSVNGLAAAQYFSEYREHFELLNKVTNWDKLKELTDAEVALIRSIADEEIEANWVNQDLILKILESLRSKAYTLL